MPDRYNLLDELRALPDHIADAQDLGMSIDVTAKLTNIVVAGMGGSGSAGHLLKTLLYNEQIPVTVVQDIKLPEWVNDKTIVLITSHSGDTEETIEMYADAVRKRATVIIITSGGKLMSSAREKNKTYIKIPTKLLPRNAVIHNLFAMLNVLANTGVIRYQKPDIYSITTILKHEGWQEKANELAKKKCLTKSL